MPPSRRCNGANGGHPAAPWSWHAELGERRSCPRDRIHARPLKKWGSALALWALAIVVWPPCLLAWRVLLGGLGSQGGADRVEVDEDGGPEGLEGGFSAAEIATFASVVAVNDQREQSLDQ